MTTSTAVCRICREEVANLDEHFTDCLATHERRDRRRRLISNLLERDAIVPEILDMTFACSAPAVEARNQSAWKLIRQFPHSDDLVLFLHGPAGTGKTFAGAAILNKAIDSAASRGEWGHVAAFVVATKLVRAMRLFEPGPILKVWESSRFLAIDDLDKPAWERRDVSALWEIIDTRQRRSLKTVFTTNIRPSELRGLLGDSHIFDSLRQRFMPRAVIQLDGESLREVSTTQRAQAARES